MKQSLLSFTFQCHRRSKAISSNASPYMISMYQLWYNFLERYMRKVCPHIFQTTRLISRLYKAINFTCPHIFQTTRSISRHQGPIWWWACANFDKMPLTGVWQIFVHMFSRSTKKSHKFYRQAAILNLNGKLLYMHQRPLLCWPCANFHWIPLHSAWETFVHTFSRPQKIINFTPRRPFWILS